MSIIQVKGSGGNVVSDRSPFYGGRVPPEIKAISKPMTKIDKQTFRKLLQSKLHLSKSFTGGLGPQGSANK